MDRHTTREQNVLQFRIIIDRFLSNIIKQTSGKKRMERDEKNIMNCHIKWANLYACTFVDFE